MYTLLSLDSGAYLNTRNANIKLVVVLVEESNNYCHRNKIVVSQIAKVVFLAITALMIVVSKQDVDKLCFRKFPTLLDIFKTSRDFTNFSTFSKLCNTSKISENKTKIRKVVNISDEAKKTKGKKQHKTNRQTQHQNTKYPGNYSER